MKPQGFNIGVLMWAKVAGAGNSRASPHPCRFRAGEGDTNFMPVLAATNCCGHRLLKEVAAQLRAALLDSKLEYMMAVETLPF